MVNGGISMTKETKDEKKIEEAKDINNGIQQAAVQLQ